MLSLFDYTRALGLSSLNFFLVLRSVLTGGGSAKRDTENGIGTKNNMALEAKLQKRGKSNACNPMYLTHVNIYAFPPSLPPLFFLVRTFLFKRFFAGNLIFVLR